MSGPDLGIVAVWFEGRAAATGGGDSFAATCFTICWYTSETMT
jgi:hypothetical protein